MKEKQTLKIGKYRLNLNTLVFLLGIAGILLIGLSSLLPRGEKAAEKAAKAEEKAAEKAAAKAAKAEERARKKSEREAAKKKQD